MDVESTSAESVHAGQPVLARRLARAVVAAAVTVLSLIAIEVAARLFDSYSLASFRLTPSTPAGKSGSNGKFDTPADAAFYVNRLPVANGVDPAWFSDPLPARQPLTPEPALQRRASGYNPDTAVRINYEWNEYYVRHVLCGSGDDATRALFASFADVFTFRPADGSEWPTFRFLRSADYPDGLHTNAFGWRSQEIALRKPARTIRIAFVGASTTVGAHSFPYSYPELVGVWLNRWAASQHPGIAFETINAGREGINSRSIQAVVTQEVIPVAPDVIVYYEGSNQFWPADYLGAATLPPRPRDSGPRPGTLAAHSDIAARVGWLLRRAVQPGAEPPKQTLTVHWPADLDERDPDVTYPNLPVNLRQILSDLDVIRRAADEHGARLTLTSFMWLVHPGMVVDPARDTVLYDYLNKVFWPFSYGHMRRYVDFQERVFRKYAAAHNLDLIDFAGRFPRDPRLFVDAIHVTNGGVHLQAWVMFNGLVPVVERAIAANSLPRAEARSIDAHPAFGPRRTLDLRAARTSCGSSPTE